MEVSSVQKRLSFGDAMGLTNRENLLPGGPAALGRMTAPISIISIRERSVRSCQHVASTSTMTYCIIVFAHLYPLRLMAAVVSAASAVEMMPAACV